MGQPLSILIIDFDEGVSMLCRDILSPDYLVMTARDCLEGAELLFHQSFSLLIIDPETPVLSAADFIPMVRRYPGFAHLPILLVTVPYQNKHPYDSLPVDRVLYEPFGVAELRQAVDELIHRPPPASADQTENRRTRPGAEEGDTPSLLAS